MVYLRTTSFQPAQLLITQSYANPNTYDARIGASAQVLEIPVRGRQAELVLGGWISSDNYVIDSSGQVISSQMIWDHESASFWLRWQENDDLYIAIQYATLSNAASVRAIEQFTPENLLEIAESLR